MNIDRRRLLQSTAALSGTLGIGMAAGRANEARRPSLAHHEEEGIGMLRKQMTGFMLAHEQFPAPELIKLGQSASSAGFDVLATSDHLQPWQANQGHAGNAWVTLAALGAQTKRSWMGTTVTCPIFRYNPAVVAQTFASLSLLYPERIFLGVGSGEALNEQVATGTWPKWQERWDRLIEAITIIRQLWTGQQVSHTGTYYSVDAKLYDAPPRPIPLLTAANGRKSMRLAGQYGDGLITDPLTWKQHKSEWEDGARNAGKNPGEMPVLVEQYVVVGDKSDAEKAAELWRFGPKAFKGYYNVPDPTHIQQRAEAEIALDKVMDGWPVGTDPQKHITTIRGLFDSGVSIVNIHAGQPDQSRIIDFYGTHVLPALRQRS